MTDPCAEPVSSGNIPSLRKPVSADAESARRRRKVQNIEYRPEKDDCCVLCLRLQMPSAPLVYDSLDLVSGVQCDGSCKSVLKTLPMCAASTGESNRHSCKAQLQRTMPGWPPKLFCLNVFILQELMSSPIGSKHWHHSSCLQRARDIIRLCSKSR